MCYPKREEERRHDSQGVGTAAAGGRAATDAAASRYTQPQTYACSIIAHLDTSSNFREVKQAALEGADMTLQIHNSSMLMYTSLNLLYTPFTQIGAKARLRAKFAHFQQT